MKIDLKKYMTERDQKKMMSAKPGPVVTISRQYGCEANKVVIKLLGRIAELNKESLTQSKWRYINKEVIEEASKELRLPVDRIHKRLTDDQKAMSDIFDSFSLHYALSDKKIIESIKNILKAYLNKGHLIIVGRGGTQLTQKRKDTLHFRIVAPLEWRAKNIANSRSVTESEAREVIEKVDKQRILWSEKVSGVKYSDELFDVTYNRKTLTEDEIVENILDLMKIRGFI